MATGFEDVEVCRECHQPDGVNRNDTARKESPGSEKRQIIKIGGKRRRQTYLELIIC